MRKMLLLATVLVMVFGLAASAGANASGIIIPSNPLWTSTGLAVSPADIVTITAAGSWTWGGGSWFGPDGDPFGCCLWDDFQNFDSGDKGRLIGYVGADPYQGNWGNGAFFPQTSGYYSIGSLAVFTPATSGTLWLGFNDDAVSMAVSDNFGYVTATIAITPVPEPGTLMLLGSGLAGVLGYGVRRFRATRGSR